MVLPAWPSLLLDMIRIVYDEILITDDFNITWNALLYNFTITWNALLCAFIMTWNVLHYDNPPTDSSSRHVINPRPLPHYPHLARSFPQYWTAGTTLLTSLCLPSHPCLRNSNTFFFLPSPPVVKGRFMVCPQHFLVLHISFTDSRCPT